MNRRNIRIVSVFAIICILISVLSICSCTKPDEAVDLSSTTTIADLEGKTIAAQTGTFHLDALKTLDNVNVKEYEDFSKLLVALKSGAIDGYVAEEPTALSIVASEKGLDYIHLINNDTGFTASDADTGIAVAFKSGSSMVNVVNPIIAGISAETRSELMAQIVEMSADTEKELGESIVLASSNTGTSNGTLKIAMECNYAPFNWRQTTDINGAVPIANMNDLYANGYDVQIAKYIAAELGMALEIYAVEWDSLIPGLQAGTYDGIIAGMSPTAEREEQVDFTDCYYNSNLVVIYKRNKKAVDLSGATNLSDLAGATIAAQTGTFHLDALKTLDNVTVDEYEDFTKLLVALNSGAIDGYVAEEPTALSIVASEKGLDYIHLINNDTGFTASDADTGIAVAFKSGSSMVNVVNPIIAGISAETRSELMAQIVEMSADTEKELGESIVLASSNTGTSNGTLKIAMECNYAPFNWRQTTDINGAVPIANMNDLYANGYDVQIAKYIAAELGMALEIYAVEWDSLIPGLQAGTYDGIIAGMSPTAEREEEVDFTDCYYNSNLVIIYKKGEVEKNFFANLVDIVIKYHPLLLEGLAYTMLIALVGTVFGLIIGLLTGIIKTVPKSKNRAIRLLQKFINFLISCYVEIFRGTPMMVQAMVIFWGYAFLNNGNTLPLLPAGIFIVSINTGAYMTEIVRGGIISIDKGQFEGAYSVGMTHWQTMTNVIIPQLMRNILPSISNEFVINIKDTSVLNVIGVMELYYMANTIQFMTYDIFETYLVICVMYFIMTFTVTRILRLAEKKLAGSDSYTICGSQSDPNAEIRVTKAKEEFR